MKLKDPPVKRHAPEPKSYRQDMNSCEASEWYEASKAEVLGLDKKETWEPVPLQRKFNTHGSIDDANILVFMHTCAISYMPFTLYMHIALHVFMQMRLKHYKIRYQHTQAHVCMYTKQETPHPKYACTHSCTHALMHMQQHKCVRKCMRRKP